MIRCPSMGAAVADEWDAGDMGCGELVFELRLRLLRLPPGDILRLRATDPGAAHDIPAWCRMTGHRLVGRPSEEHYDIRREDA